MLPLYRTLSLRHLRRRWSRAALIVASIALGVATLVATRALNGSMTTAARSAVNPLAGFADLQVSNGTFGVPAELVEEIRAARLPGVRAVQPLVLGRVALIDLAYRPAEVLGVDVEPGSTASNPWGVQVQVTHPLALLAGGRTVFVGAELAAALPQGIGSVRVRVGGREHQLAGAGTVDAAGPAAALGGSVLVMRRADAAALLGKPGRVTRIDLALEPGAQAGAVRDRLAAVLAGRAEVASPEAANDSLRDVMAGLELGFELNGAGALIVGLFLVYNALAVSVAERRHDIGVLRAVGATRTQVAALFAGEAGMLGLAGALVGLPLGLGLAHLALGPLQRILSDIFLFLPMEQVQVGPRVLLGAAAAGMATALAASLVPALQAAREEPADAVRRAPRSASWRWRLLHVACCLAILGTGLGCVLLRDLLPLRYGTFGGVVLLLVSGLAASPLLAAAAAGLLRLAARQLLGVEGRLAADNLTRSPGRTGLVVAALGAGVALVLQTAGVVQSSEEGVLAWVDEAIGADLFVTAHSPVSSGAQGLAMRDEVGRKMASLPDVEAALPVRFQRIGFGGRTVFLIALDAAGFHAANQRRPTVLGRELYARLPEPGTAVVSDNFAALHRVAPGERIEVRGPHGPVPLQIIGTLLDYSWNRGTIFLDLAQYRQHFDDPLVDVFDIYVRPGADPEAVRAQILRRWGAEESLVVLTRQELRASISSMIRRLYGIAYAQEAVVGLVAVLGVVTALLISVLQRQRELGLLRAVGASQGQVLRSVLAEATLLGLVGAVVGLLVGIPLEWYVVRVLLFDEAGFLLPLRVPWLTTGLLVAGAITISTLAGLGPALHAVRLRIPEAIAYE